MKRVNMFRFQCLITAVVFLIVSLGITVVAAAPTAQNFTIDVRTERSYTFYSIDKFGANISGEYDSIAITSAPQGIFTYNGEQINSDNLPFVIPKIGFSDLRYEAIDGSADSFSWQAVSGSDYSNEAIVSINISEEANNSPIASDYTLYARTSRAIYLNILATDADQDDLLYSIPTQPSKGTASISATGRVTYTASAETGMTSFPVAIDDQMGGVTQVTVTVYITALTLTTVSPINVTIWTSDNPLQSSGSIEATTTYGTVSLSTKTSPTKGHVSYNGLTWTYVPNAAVAATDSFVINVRDDAGNVQTVTVNVTVLAEQFTVTFDLQGGIGTASTTAYYNSLLTAPAVPTKTGFTFAGWYKDLGYETAWNFAADKVMKETTLYARWTQSTSVITTTVTGAGSISPQNPTVVYGASQPFTITPESGNRIKSVLYNGSDVKSQLSNGVYTANAVITNGTLSVEFEAVPTYTVTVNSGSGGSVTADPSNATVYEGGTVTFSITPDATHQIGTVKFDDRIVGASGGVYTTPALNANAILEVSFVAKVKTPPTISIIQPGRVGQQVFNGKSELSDKVVNNLNIDFSYLTYATISNPDDYSIVNFGMVLTELGTGRTMDLPVVYKSDNGQFAVQIFGSAFQVGHQYSLQGYLNYTDDDTTTKLVTSEAVEKFGWL